MPGTFTPELIRRVIDELGGEYRECPSFVRVRKALHACTLVSKRWTAHSRTHLLRKVEINAGRHQPTIAPPASVLPYVKDLRIFYGCRPTRATSIADLLKALFATPIEYLGITGVEFVDERICVQEFIEVHSATLQTVELESCSLSASDVVSILLGRHHLKRLLLVDCRCESPPPPGQSLVADTPDPNASSEIVELELSITGGDPFEGSANTVTTIAQLPHRFSRLAIDHLIAGEETTEATNALIKANADVLSSLQVNFIAEDMEIDFNAEPEHLFSLEGCSSLSELILDMARSELCAVRDSISILSTLDPEGMNRLEKIVLKYNYVGRWFDKNDQLAGEDDEVEDWEGLDDLLTQLANTSIAAREKRLTFTLVVSGYHDIGKTMSMLRGWLPKMLPRFHELGLLHIHRDGGNHCRVVDDSCLHHHKPECLKEDFRDGR